MKYFKLDNDGRLVIETNPEVEKIKELYYKLDDDYGYDGFAMNENIFLVDEFGNIEMLINIDDKEKSLYDLIKFFNKIYNEIFIVYVSEYEYISHSFNELYFEKVFENLGLFEFLL
jgi:hypothetical protein